VLIPALLLALAVPSSARADADSLSITLQAKAPSILQYLQKDKGFKNVGVLKYLVDNGDGQARDDVGDLNLTLANKTQIALTLANTDENFGIIDHPSEFVAREKLLTANHRDVPGRQAFFTRKYPLAWSSDPVEASGFITGLATVDANQKVLTVQLQVFDRSGTIENLGGKIIVPLDPEILAQAGRSYALPNDTQKAIVTGGPAPTRDARQQQAVDQMLRVSDPPQSANPPRPEPFSPLLNCPVHWTILYNNKPVPVIGNTVPEPTTKDEVGFHLRNPGPGTYAVVLLVNGENTLYQERSAPLACRKWVLPPKAEVTVRGFQTGPKSYVPFVVLPPGKTDPDLVRYSEHAGTYRLVVYHGTTTTSPPADTTAKLNQNEASLEAIARTRGASQPQGVKAQSLEALQADLRGRAKTAEGSRGYVTKGAGTGTLETETVYFVPSSDVPVADVSLRYVPKK
jgi:hypothetical protein